MNKFWDWFAEVHQQTVLWWQIGLAICVFEAFASFSQGRSCFCNGIYFCKITFSYVCNYSFVPWDNCLFC